MKIRPTKTAPACRPMRQMSERVGEVPLPAPVPEPDAAAWETGAATADEPTPPKRPARASGKPKRQALKRVSAEHGTCRSTGATGKFNPVLTEAMRQRLLAVAIAPRFFRQAEAYVSDWNAHEKVILDGRPVEVVRGRSLATCAIPRTPESRWNLHALEDMEALLDEAARQETAREIAEAWQEVATEQDLLGTNRAMRTQDMKARHYARYLELEGMA